MIIYNCHKIQHEADLGMGLRFIRKHRRYYLHQIIELIEKGQFSLVLEKC